MSEKKIVYRIEDNMNPQDVLCTTYQMRNFYHNMKDGFYSNLDIMNYIQHEVATKYAKKNMRVVDVCCGRSLVLPLLRWHCKNIKEYIGVDICEANIREAKRGCSRNIEKDGITVEEYYPFKVNWINSNVDSMSKYIEKESTDFVIYTSAIEHMHKDVGIQSLKECYKIMKPNSIMFLSCPNTPGNGYNTQYRAHVYEWGYDELKQMLKQLDFEIIQEVGLIMKIKKMNNFFESNEISDEIKEFYRKLKNYIPTTWLSAIMSIPYPQISDEILFIVKKNSENSLQDYF
ncbi:class I SAM-dependent methyltransferase [bacterium]|nr:class I SAM-dependent methyltransferase [bacterium]